MKCSEHENNILLSVYGELDKASEAELKEHLTGCAKCRATVEEYRSVLETSRAVEVEPLPEAAVDNIKRAVKAEIIATPIKGPVRRWTSFMRYAAAILIVLFIWLLLPRGTETDGPRHTAMTTTNTIGGTNTIIKTATTPTVEKSVEEKIDPRAEVEFARFDRMEKKLNRLDGGVALAKAYLGRKSTGGSGRLTRLEGRIASAKRDLKSILGDNKPLSQ